VTPGLMLPIAKSHPNLANQAFSKPDHALRPELPNELLSFFRSLYGPVPRKRLRSEDSRQPFFLLPRHWMPGCRYVYICSVTFYPVTLTFVLFVLCSALLSETAGD
jgi:hypothetical protein